MLHGHNGTTYLLKYMYLSPKWCRSDNMQTVDALNAEELRITKPEVQKVNQEAG